MKSNQIVSLSAILISIGTLVVFLYQTNLIRKQQYMSVFPYLEFNNYANLSNKYRFVLENNGVGPALIKSTQVLINGEKRADDIGSYLLAIISRSDSINFSITTVSEGNLIPEKEKLNLVELVGLNSEAGAARLLYLINNDSLEFMVEYESIYGEKWILSTNRQGPEKVN